jgi:S-formylglutathione hydrolase FrmB
MKNITILFGTLILLSALNLQAGVMIKKSFFSQALNQEKSYFISYPTGYLESDTATKFPVIIFLHGASTDAQTIANQLDVLLENVFTQAMYQNIYKTIFIIADGSAPPFLGSFYTNSSLYGDFETYIVEDLYQEISSNYNTYNHRAKWSIMGHSMGGYGSMKIALKNPEKFIGVASLSGPLHTTYYNDILPMIYSENGNEAPYDFSYQGSVTKLVYSMAGAFSPNSNNNPPVDFPILPDGTMDQDVIPLWETHNPINLISQWGGSPEMGIYFYCGEMDEYKLLPQNQLFSDSLNAKGIEHTFRIDPTGEHVTSLLTSFPFGMNFLINVMDTAQIPGEPNFIASKKNVGGFVYPNPATNYLGIDLLNNAEIINAEIISITGAIINKADYHFRRGGMDISGLKPGHYHLRVFTSDRKTLNFKFVKTIN